MANLKDLKLRIRSVKSTQKITKAMKMVSASKLRRAREAIEANRPYAKQMAEITQIVASNTASAKAIPFFYGKEEVKTALFIVITSDRGLCGALNSSVVRMVKRKIVEAKRQNLKVQVLCMGKKGYAQLLAIKDIELKMVDNFAYGKNIEVAPLRNLAKDLIEEYSKSSFDLCYVFYNKFISAVAQVTSSEQIIPLFKQEQAMQEEEAQFEFEPEAAKMVDNLVERNITINLFSMLLENIASEHGARMTAMENASNNAGSMIKDLTVLYNRTRQAAITTELIEIISGAEAI